MPQPIRIDPADWAAIVQSELAAMAVDREGAERIAALAQAWGELAVAHDGDDRPSGRAGPDAPAGTAPAGAAPGAGDDAARRDAEIAELRQRLAELEAAARS